MLLAIDVGNSNTVLGLYDGEKLIYDWRIRTVANHTVDEYGMLIVNLWGSDKELFASYCDWLNSAFQERVLFLPVNEHDNIIGLAFNHGAPLYSMKALRSKAEALESVYRIEFSSFLKTLSKHNPGAIQRVITK